MFQLKVSGEVNVSEHLQKDLVSNNNIDLPLTRLQSLMSNDLINHHDMLMKVVECLVMGVIQVGWT